MSGTTFGVRNWKLNLIAFDDCGLSFHVRLETAFLLNLKIKIVCWGFCFYVCWGGLLHACVTPKSGFASFLRGASALSMHLQFGIL